MYGMPFRIKVSLIALLALAALLFVVPLVVPISPPPGVEPLAVVAGDAEYVTVNGTALHLVRYGPEPNVEEPALAEAPPLLLLHDYAFNAGSFAEFGPLLAARAGSAAAFDRPGYGLSERPLPERGEYALGYDPYTPAAQVEYTIGVMNALGFERALLLGVGSGGRVALDVAALHPERVAGLALIDTPAFLDEGRQAPNWLLNSPQMQRLGPVFLRQLAEGPGEQLLTGAFFDPSKITAEMRETISLNTSVEGWDEALWQISRSGRKGASSEVLPKVLAPTLVIGGANSAADPQLAPGRLADQLKRAASVTLSECGRAPQLECPERLLDELLGWLGAINAAEG